MDTLSIDYCRIILYSDIMNNINTKLTKAEMKALVIVLSAGYASGKDSDDDVRDIFIKDYEHQHALDLGFAYTRALDKLGLDDFFDNNQKYIERNRSA